MNRLVFNIVLLLGLTSCGTLQKNVSQEVQAEMQTLQTDSTDIQRIIDKMVRAKLDEILNKEVSQNVTIDRKIWSPPDTSGNQYLVQEETIKTVMLVKETKQSVIETVEDITEKTDSVSVSAVAADLDVDTKTDIEEKAGLPWWQKTLMIIGGFVLLALIVKIALKFL